jgi:hypothetical protein
MAKQVTREQAARKKAQGATLLERIGEPDRAAEFDGMSVEEYVEHRGFQPVANPKRKARKTNMATKTELQETIDSAIERLNEAYTPETTGEDLAAAVGEELDILNGEDADKDDDDSRDDSEDDEEGELPPGGAGETGARRRGK